MAREPQQARIVLSTRQATAAVAGLLFALSTFQLPQVVAGDELDFSWQQTLNYAFKHDWVAGRDYLFTFGPLGFVQNPTYDPELFSARVVWELAFASFAGIAAFFAMQRIPGSGRRLLFFLVLWLSTPLSRVPLLMLFATARVLWRDPPLRSRLSSPRRS